MFHTLVITFLFNLFVNVVWFHCTVFLFKVLSLTRIASDGMGGIWLSVFVTIIYLIVLIIGMIGSCFYRPPYLIIVLYSFIT